MDRRFLYYSAAAFWGIPGMIITVKGIKAYLVMPSHKLWWLLLITAFVVVGFLIMFRKIVDKYSARIAAQPQKTAFRQTFPLRGWILIVCMSCLGIALRFIPGIPAEFTASFYSGLGPMLVFAACRFIANQKRIILTAICLLITLSVSAQDSKLRRGFDGGMMVHTGYLRGNLDAIGYEAKGLPMGIGGVIRLHLGEHFRIGSEGYVSTLGQRSNGSYLKYGWGGILADSYTVLGKFQPYAGITLGGGSMTTLLMLEEPESPWAPINCTRYHKQGLMAIDPFIGCDLIVSGPMHLTLKVDYLCALSDAELLPHGPRVYFGFLFYH